MNLEETNVLQVVSGSLTFYVFDATSQPLVGCSGGVYCLVGTTIYELFLLFLLIFTKYMYHHQLD